MFWKKPTVVTCAVCGKRIETGDKRIVDKHRATGTERHVHLACSGIKIDRSRHAGS